MTLQYRYDIPESPLLQIDKSQLPPIPDVNIPQLNHILPDIALRIVNQSVLQAGKNPMRMFCFNVLSYNNWRNQAFEDVFRWSVDFLIMSLNKTATSPQFLVDPTVDQILTLFSSQLVFDFPELQSVISPQHYDASCQNAGLFNNLKAEMTRMSYNGQAYNGQPQYPPYQQPVYQQQPQVVNQPMYIQDPRTGQFIPVQNGYPQVGHHIPMSVPMQQLPPHLQQGQRHLGSAFARPGPQVVTSFSSRPDPTLTRDYNIGQSEPLNPVLSKTDSRMENISQDRYFRHSTASKPSHVPDIALFEDDQNVFITSDETFLNKGPVNSTTHSGGVVMNRQQHEMSHGNGVNTITHEEAVKEIVGDGSELEYEIHPGIAVDLSLSAAIAQYRLDTAKTEVPEIHRKYLLIPDLIVSSVDVSSYLPRWTKCDSLLELALKLQISLSDLSGSTPSEELSNALSLIRELDHLLTKKVNQFLRETLETETLWIESFMEDYSDLAICVLQEFGAYGSEELKLFDASVCQGFKSETISLCLKESDGILTCPDGTYVGYIPSTYTLTLIPVDRVDLKIPAGKLKGNKKIILHPDVNKLLYDLMKDLLLDGDANNFFDTVKVERHIFVTKDGVRYQAFKTLGKNELYIKAI